MSDLESGLLVVRSQPEVRSLEDVLLGERDAPVIVLTQSVETLQPVLSPEHVRAIVGPEAAILYVPGDYLLRRLRATLGDALAVSRGAARIFWPGLRPGGDGTDHPLVPILDGESPEEAIAEFTRQFDLSRPHVRREIRLIEDARSMLQSELDAALKDARASAEQLRDANIDRHDAVMRAERAEDRLGGEEQSYEKGRDEALYLLIAKEWLRAFLPDDRQAYPLGGHLLTDGFIAAVTLRPELPLERLAWTCAMVACGYAQSLPGIALRPLLDDKVGGQLRRGDGALAWCCRIKGPGAREAPLLHYWVTADQMVEFADISDREAMPA